MSGHAPVCAWQVDQRAGDCNCGRGTMTQTPRTSPQEAFRAGYAQAKLDAVDRCRVEMPHPNVAGARCIAAIEALDVRHAANMRLKRVVDDAVGTVTARDPAAVPEERGCQS